MNERDILRDDILALNAQERVIGTDAFARLTERARRRFLADKMAVEAHVRRMVCMLYDDESLCMLGFSV